MDSTFDRECSFDQQVPPSLTVEGPVKAVYQVSNISSDCLDGRPEFQNIVVVNASDIVYSCYGQEGA
jgi:hypothetical protein